METEQTGETGEKMREDLPRINFRPLVYCAIGLFYGAFLAFRFTFGDVSPSDFCFLLVLLALSLFPFRWKRVLCVAVALAVFGGAGAGLACLRTARFLDARGGTFSVTGTVSSFTVENGRSDAVLKDLSFDGEPVDGKLRARFGSEEVRAGDVVAFTAQVTVNGLPMPEDSYGLYLFYNDIRYEVSSAEYTKTGVGTDPFYRIDSALYDLLSEHIGGEEAEVAYALLTGRTGGINAGLSETIRRGGIAHIFSVSGLHIGILFAAVMLLFKPLGRKAYFPALAFALCYAAFCSFSVSSVRALVMCAVLGGCRALGRKYDFLSSLALAALCVIFADPADLLSPGFTLSFGACAGIALFSGPLRRLFAKIPHLPQTLSSYLSANLSVQFFTFPFVLGSFGYFSVWGILLNLIFVPVLPVFFLTTLVFSLLALMIPPAAGVFLLAPKGLLTLFLWICSGGFRLVLTGFALGMGGTVFVVGAVFLSERVRLSRLVRGCAAGLLALLFALSLFFENATLAGVRVDVSQTGEVLLRTPDAAVLVMGDDALSGCEEFLSRTYGGKLDAVVVLSDNEAEVLGRAVFLGSSAVIACDEVPTGLSGPVTFEREGEIGGIRFRFERRNKLAVVAEGVVLEIDFEDPPAIGADFFVTKGAGRLKFFLYDGIIYTWRGLFTGASGGIA